jgi:hypothetical protein
MPVKGLNRLADGWKRTLSYQTTKTPFRAPQGYLRPEFDLLPGERLRATRDGERKRKRRSNTTEQKPETETQKQQLRQDSQAALEKFRAMLSAR